MPQDTAKFEARVRQEWMDEVTAQAWRRWHDKSVVFWQELTDAMLAVAQLAPGQRVLDLASGTGDPALMVAKIVGPTGHVAITDLAPQMLDIARDFAARDGLANVSFEIVDAHTLPYPDASFDCVTCRLGVMFFWDCQRALAEIRRVLKPGGVAAFVAWGPVEQNEFMRTVMGPFKKRQPPPVPPPGAPHPYRFGAPGSLTAELKGAGFGRVSEESRTVRMVWPGPPAELWTRSYEIAAPLRPYYNSFSEEVRAEAIKEVISGFTQFFDGKNVVARTTIVVASATK